MGECSETGPFPSFPRRGGRAAAGVVSKMPRVAAPYRCSRRAVLRPQTKVARAPFPPLPPLNPHTLHHYIRNRPISPCGWGFSDLLDDIHTFDDFPEDGMFAIQMRCRHQGDKELAAVRVRAGVGHGQNSLPAVFQLRMDLVGELIPRPA